MATHGNGLIRWNPATGERRIFTTADGLSNDKLHAVYPDRNGYLWLPSDFGLMRFEKASGKVQTFFESDGLASNEFNLTSHFRAPDGRLYLGGVNGITSFMPDEIPIEPQRTARLQLMEAKTFNLRSGKYSLQALPADPGEPVRLHPSDAFLDLSLSALQFDRSDLYRFAWKIEGVQDNWIEQTEPNIRLSNLPYGQHSLLVRFSRQGNQWQGEELVIPIAVLRPFYLDWPFLLLLLLAMAGMAWLLTLWRTRRLAAANLRLEKEVARRTRQIETDRALIARQADELRSLDEMKSRFFANVTHELRTPLTLILGPLDRLLQAFQPEPETAETLRTIRKNALRLLNLVEELLELSRMESGKLHLEEKPLDFHPFLSRLIAAFLPYAEHRGIRLGMDYRCDISHPLLLDARKWEKIVTNLLSNALKFTPRDGHVTLSVHCETSDRMILGGGRFRPGHPTGGIALHLRPLLPGQGPGQPLAGWRRHRSGPLPGVRPTLRRRADRDQQPGKWQCLPPCLPLPRREQPS
jgi:signal transduction histidine kinase